MIVINTIASILQALAAIYLVYITWKIFSKNVNILKEAKIETRYFDHVVLFALKELMTIKNNINSVLNALEEEETRKVIRGKIDEINNFFYSYKNDVSLRLKIFDISDEDLVKFWEKIETEMTEKLNSFALEERNNREEIKKAIIKCLDDSILKIRNKNFIQE